MALAYRIARSKAKRRPGPRARWRTPYRGPSRTGWTLPALPAYAPPVPTVTHIDTELADAAMIARAAAWRASQDSLAQANAVAETPFEATDRY